jgi:hypothetical protein
MYISDVRKRSGLGETFPMEAEIAENKRRQEELAQKELLARTKMLTDKYGPMYAYKIIKGFMTEAQAAAEVAAKLSAMKTAAEAKIVSTAIPGTELVPGSSITGPKTITPGTADGAAAGKTKISLTWILIGLAAILFGPKLIKG